MSTASNLQFSRPLPGAPADPQAGLMWAEEFRECMEAAHWSIDAAAQALGFNRNTIMRWRANKLPVRADAAARMREVRAWFDAHPFVRADNAGRCSIPLDC